MTSAVNQHYWGEYTNLQKVKHDLIENYLNGWFPKLAFWSPRVLYFDTHAGRGRHLSGQCGSPLVALRTFLNHRARDQILDRGREVRFTFIEKDEENYNQLRHEITEFGALPDGVSIHPHQDDCFHLFQSVIESLKANSAQMAPAFAFVDPYGFKVPCHVLKDLMAVGRVELFINVIWRELNMSISLAKKDLDGGHAKNLDLVFGGREWQARILSDNADERAEEAIELFRDQIGAQWATRIRMLGDNGATRYLLLHLTNHDEGRDLMKDCMWKVCPDGGFYARKTDNPNQALLITPEPDLSPLREWILARLREGSKRWNELTGLVREELWRQTHLNSELRALRKNGSIIASGFTGRFSQKANPLFSLP